MQPMLNQAFAYVIYGTRPEYYRQAAYSLLSLLAHTADTPVLVLAEDPAALPEHPRIRTVPLTESLKAHLLGGSDYHFTLKLNGLAHLLANFSKKLIFLDTDTAVRCDLNPLFDQIDSTRCLLHVLEGRLGRRRFSRQYAAVLNMQFTPPEHAPILVSAESPMYNSGLIGVESAHLRYWPTVRWLMQEIDRRISFHTAEQFALGVVLGLHLRIGTVGDQRVYHYWHKGPKRYMNELLDSYFQKHAFAALLHSPEQVLRLSLQRPPLRWLRDKLGIADRP